MAAVDEAIKQSFIELKTKQHATMQKIQQVEGQMQAKGQARRRAELTAAELGGTPEDANMYKGVGKAYVLTPRAELLAQLDKTASTCSEDVAGLEGQREALIAQMQGLKQEVNELVRAHPAAMKVIADEFA